MLNSSYKSFKSHLTQTFPDYFFEDYRGEFEEKVPAGWNPVFPCCLIKLDEYAPLARSSANEIIKSSLDLTLYIAEKNTSGFSTISNIFDALNGLHIEMPLNLSFYAQVNSVKYLKAFNSVRVHTMEISIS